jgi:hypothetical protein
MFRKSTLIKVFFLNRDTCPGGRYQGERKAREVY